MCSNLSFNFPDHHGDALVNCYQSHSEAVSTRYYRYKRNGNFTEAEEPPKDAAAPQEPTKLTADLKEPTKDTAPAETPEKKE